MFSVLLKTSVQVALQWWLYKNNEMRGRKRHVYIYIIIYIMEARMAMSEGKAWTYDHRDHWSNMLGPLPSLHTSSIYMYLPTICVPKVYHSKYKLFMRYMSISSRGSCIHNQVSIIYNHAYNNIHIQSYKYRVICKKNIVIRIIRTFATHHRPTHRSTPTL